jgi:hypothetical protein
MKVLVCGGRRFAQAPQYLNLSTEQILEVEALAEKQRSFLFRVLNEIHSGDSPGDKPSAITLLIHGDARGADRTAGTWAMLRGVPREVFKARWAEEDGAAGPLRNQRMLDIGQPDLVVAFPGGSGTADMVARARKAGIPLRIIEESEIV